MTSRTMITFVGTAALIALIACVGCRTTEPAVAAEGTLPTPEVAAAAIPPEEVKARAAEFFATQPEYLRPLADSAPPAGLTAMDVGTCGGCHLDHTLEWRDSIHARAWDDDQYQVEMEKDPAIRWICINCHLPQYDQQAQLPVGLIDGDLRRPILADNPGYSETLRDDAIGCAACHVRDAHVEGPTGEAPGAPHATRINEQLTRSAFCLRCHGVEAYVEQLDLICAFATGREWESWVATQPADAARRCQDCHMPAVEHRRWAGADPSTGRHHAFPGSLIPKRPSDAEAFEALQELFPEGATVDVAFDPPAPRAGQPCALVVTITNAHAGHHLPTGDPERYLELTATVRDDAGAVVAEHTEVIRARYEWYPKPKLLSDNRLAGGESRALRVPIDAAPAGALSATVRLGKYRIDEHALAYHDLEGVVVPGRESVRAEARVAVAP